MEHGIEQLIGLPKGTVLLPIGVCDRCDEEASGIAAKNRTRNHAADGPRRFTLIKSEKPAVFIRSAGIARCIIAALVNTTDKKQNKSLASSAPR
jgi:hypothetical protein